MIKKITILPIMFLLCFIGIMTLGCEKDEQITNTYKTLVAAAETYNASMETLADLYNQGKITEEDKEKAITYGKAYTVAFNTAVETLKKYYNSPNEFKDFLKQDILNMTTALNILTNFINAFKNKGTV